jgi:hypothetical protein
VTKSKYEPRLGGRFTVEYRLDFDEFDVSTVRHTSRGFWYATVNEGAECKGKTEAAAIKAAKRAWLEVQIGQYIDEEVPMNIAAGLGSQSMFAGDCILAAHEARFVTLYPSDEKLLNYCLMPRWYPMRDNWREFGEKPHVEGDLTLLYMRSILVTEAAKHLVTKVKDNSLTVRLNLRGFERVAATEQAWQDDRYHDQNTFNSLFDRLLFDISLAEDRLHPTLVGRLLQPRTYVAVRVAEPRDADNDTVYTLNGNPIHPDVARLDTRIAERRKQRRDKDVGGQYYPVILTKDGPIDTRTHEGLDELTNLILKETYNDREGFALVSGTNAIDGGAPANWLYVEEGSVLSRLDREETPAQDAEYGDLLTGGYMDLRVNDERSRPNPSNEAGASYAS